MSETDEEPATPDSVALERRVASHYEALGYRIRTDIKVLNHQVDMLATKYVDPGVELNLMIEVKHRSKAPVGIQEVGGFVATASHLLSGFAINGAVMVTNADYSQHAKGAVLGRSTVQLLTIEQLEETNLDYAFSLQKIVEEHRATSLHEHYIPLKGRLPEWGFVPDIVHLAVAQSADWRPILILSGDFGSGKTSIMDRIRYEQALRRQRNPRAPYPVFLRLRGLRQYTDIWHFVRDGLRDEQYQNMSRANFESQLRLGRFLMLLDGFDEINTSATPKDRGRYLKFLSPLLDTASACIISSRPTFFESFEDMAKVFDERVGGPPDFGKGPHNAVDISALLEGIEVGVRNRLKTKKLRKRLEIQPLGQHDITAYIAQYQPRIGQVTGLKSTEIKARLDEIYDLEDLMSRPLLLRMIVETILAGRVNIVARDEKIGPSTLYHIYTAAAAYRDDSRPDQLLTDAERLAVSRQIAMSMLDAGVIELPPTSVREALTAARIPRFANIPHDSEYVDRLLTDIRVCSFLALSGNGTLRFTHRSFYEFFVAQQLFIGIDSNYALLKAFARRKIAREIIYFIGSYARDNEAFGRLIAKEMVAVGHDATTERNFLGRVLFASAVMLEKRNIVSASISDAELCRASIDGAYFRTTDFTGVSIRRIRATSWRLEQCEFRSSRIVDSLFQSSAVSLLCRSVDFARVTVAGGTFAIAGSQWRFEQSSFEACDVEFDGPGILEDCTIRGPSTVKLGDNLRLDGRSAVTFADCRIVASRAQYWLQNAHKVEAQRCTLLGIWLPPAEIRQMVAGAGDFGVFRATACNGLLLTSDPEGLMRPEQIARFRALHPELLLVDYRPDWQDVERPKTSTPARAISAAFPAAEVLNIMKARGWDESLAGHQILAQLRSEARASR